jgi:hypothetical protein
MIIAIANIIGSSSNDIFVGAAPTTQLLLDEYPNAAAAYSLRELSTAFVGQPIVRVRRSSDNVEQDFTATEITDGTLTTFTGANDGFVTTWYDQSGNAKNAIQNTTTLQPEIVSSGVLYLLNGKPCIFSKENDRFIASGTVSDWKFLNFGTSSIFTVDKPNIGVQNYHLFGTSSGAYVGRRGVNLRMGSSYSASDGTNIIAESNISISYSQQLLSIILDTSNAEGNRLNFYRDGLILGNDTGIGTPLDVNPESNLTMFYRANAPSQGYLGLVSELIFYNLDQTLNRTEIETNINDHYNIY